MPGTVKQVRLNEEQFLAAFEEGKQALRDGKTLDHEMVVAAFERIAKGSINFVE